MMIIIAPLIIAGLILCLGLKNEKSRTRQGKRVIQKCPNCGSPVTIRGTHWECTYCGNSGVL